MGLKIIKRLLSVELLSVVGFSLIWASAGKPELFALLQIPVQTKRPVLEHSVPCLNRYEPHQGKWCLVLFAASMQWFEGQPAWDLNSSNAWLRWGTLGFSTLSGTYLPSGQISGTKSLLPLKGGTKHNKEWRRAPRLILKRTALFRWCCAVFHCTSDYLQIPLRSWCEVRGSTWMVL